MVSHYKNISLATFNSFGIDVTADHLFSFQNASELVEIFSLPEMISIRELNLPLLILGEGCNILLCKDIKGAILKNDIQFINKIEDTSKAVVIEVGAGVNLHSLVDYTIDNQWGGIENLSLIPGSVGAAPIQNVGAYGVEVSSVIEKVIFFDIKKKEFIEFDNKDCDFGYRDSIFKNSLKGNAIICSVFFKLQKKPVFNFSYGAIQEELERRHITNITLKDISSAIINIRKSKLPDPKLLGNAGSFFKNPSIDEPTFQKLKAIYPHLKYYKLGNLYKIYAGWLIETAGWKGYRKNHIGCFEKQALILVNYGAATGKEILALALEIQKSIFDKFSITLEMEVNIIN